jgi:hypothetical protein
MVFQKVDLNEGLKSCFSELPDDVGLSDLPCSGNQQRLFIFRASLKTPFPKTTRRGIMEAPGGVRDADRDFR